MPVTSAITICEAQVKLEFKNVAWSVHQDRCVDLWKWMEHNKVDAPQLDVLVMYRLCVKVIS